MERMGAALTRMGANVAYVYLPSGDGGEKVGADDFLADGHDLADVVSLASSELRKPSTSVPPSGGPEPRASVHKAPALAYEPDLLARFCRDVGRLGRTSAAGTM
jgi:hypothetical protein